MLKNKVLKVILQGLLILGLLQIGNLISALIKSVIFIPGNLIGMMLMFILLLTGVLKLNHIEELSGFLLKHMGFFFIPLGVSLVNSVDMLKAVWIELLIILIVSCAAVMFVSAKVTEWMMVLIEKRRQA